MSQKTNPISLRLQKTNKHFESCWYSDYLYSEMSSHDFRIRSYIESALDQTAHSSALLSVQSQYKKANIHLFLLDARGIRHEKEQILRMPGGRLKIPLRRMAFPSLVFSTKDQKEEIQSCNTIWSDKSRLWCSVCTDFCFNFMFSNKIKEQTCFGRISSPHAGALTKNLRSPQPKILDKALLQSRESSSSLERGSNSQPPTGVRGSGDVGLNGGLFRQLIVHNHLRRMKKLNPCQNCYWGQLGRINIKCDQSASNASAASFVTFTGTGNPREIVSVLKRKSKTGPFQQSMEMILSLQSSLLAGFYPVRVMRDLQNPQFLIHEIVYLLQKRVAFRQVKDQILRQVGESDIIKGIRLSCSGRLGGRSKKAQKSKTQSVQWGETSLHVLSSKLWFSSKSASTPFGKVGVKLWLCYK